MSTCYHRHAHVYKRRVDSLVGVVENQRQVYQERRELSEYQEEQSEECMCNVFRKDKLFIYQSSGRQRIGGVWDALDSTCCRGQ
jgi:hypothetical protein